MFVCDYTHSAVLCNAQAGYNEKKNGKLMMLSEVVEILKYISLKFEVESIIQSVNVNN